MTVLGIESSCDETSAAVLRDGVLLSNIISSQFFHREFGGIVPELASRAHVRAIVPIIRQALEEAAISLRDVQLVAATQGPGLIGSLLVGLNAGKAIASSLRVPFLGVHHIEAHMFSTFLSEAHPDFPFLSLVVSGGHTLLVHVRDVGTYRTIGSTIDDAAGEAYDKVGKMLGLGFPGGPEIDRRAALGAATAIAFPRPLIDSGDFGFSFSGLKTSVLYHLRKHHRDALRNAAGLAEDALNDICASFQRAVTDVLIAKTLRAADALGVRDIALAGGVSANRELRARLADAGARQGRRVFVPEAAFTTDNAAMIAQLAFMQQARGVTGSLHAPAFARVSPSMRHAAP